MSRLIHINVDEDDLDQVARDSVLEAYYCSWETIEHYENNPPSADFQKEDLKDAKKNMKAAKRMVKYFSTPEQWKQFNGE